LLNIFLFRKTPNDKVQTLRNHLTLDCSGAMRGLFAGLMVLVLTVISIVIFFIFLGSQTLPPYGEGTVDDHGTSNIPGARVAVDGTQADSHHGIETRGQQPREGDGVHHDLFQKAMTMSHVTLILLNCMASVAVCLAAHYFKVGVYVWIVPCICYCEQLIQLYTEMETNNNKHKFYSMPLIVNSLRDYI